MFLNSKFSKLSANIKDNKTMDNFITTYNWFSYVQTKLDRKYINNNIIRNEIYTNSQANISVLKKSLDERSCSNTFIMPSQRALEERIVMKTIGRGRLYLSNSTATSSSQISYSVSFLK